MLVTHMSLEKLKLFFCPHSLVSIWSPQVWPLAAPRQASAASRLSSVPTVPVLLLPKKSEAAGIVKTCRSSRKPNCSNPFSKRYGKVKPWGSLKSAKPMKQKLAKKSRLLPSTACWLATAGSLPVRIIQRIRIECNCHKCSAQILCFWLYGPATPMHLGYYVSEPSRFCSCRSYLCASGGYC